MEKVEVFLPDIAESDYDDIRVLVQDLPAERSDWIRRRDDYEAARVKQGDVVGLIQITPGALKEHLGGRQGNKQELMRLAEGIGRGGAGTVQGDFDPFSASADTDDYDPFDDGD